MSRAWIGRQENRLKCFSNKLLPEESPTAHPRTMEHYGKVPGWGLQNWRHGLVGKMLAV